jgi:hypothetical protein
MSSARSSPTSATSSQMGSSSSFRRTISSRRSRLPGKGPVCSPSSRRRRVCVSRSLSVPQERSCFQYRLNPCFVGACRSSTSLKVVVASRRCCMSIRLQSAYVPPILSSLLVSRIKPERTCSYSAVRRLYRQTAHDEQEPSFSPLSERNSAKASTSQIGSSFLFLFTSPFPSYRARLHSF